MRTSQKRYSGTRHGATVHSDLGAERHAVGALPKTLRDAQFRLMFGGRDALSGSRRARYPLQGDRAAYTLAWQSTGYMIPSQAASAAPARWRGHQQRQEVRGDPPPHGLWTRAAFVPVAVGGAARCADHGRSLQNIASTQRRTLGLGRRRARPLPSPSCPLLLSSMPSPLRRTHVAGWWRGGWGNQRLHPRRHAGLPSPLTSRREYGRR
jgi:hypothetical protein